MQINKLSIHLKLEWAAIGKENYDNFIEAQKIIDQKFDNDEKLLEDAMSVKRSQLYSGSISFTEFDKYQKDYVETKYKLRDGKKQQIEDISKKYGDVNNIKLQIIKEVQKDINAKYGSLSDVVDGANKGALNLIGFGHGKRYWGQSSHTRGDEFFAEAFSAKSTNPKGYEIFNKYFPKTMEIFEEILKRSK